MDFIVKEEDNFRLIQSLLNEMQNAFIMQNKVNDALQEQINHLSSELDKTKSQLAQVTATTEAY